ncbi:hypothetical protein CLAIMM_02492 [Cladophialophora immunda]|nr:hypothetical protein CLAIMM_02492 [Cladophialophora immunda]
MLKTQSDIQEMADVVHEERPCPDRVDVELKSAKIDLEQPHDETRLKKLVRRIDLRIVPLLSFMYLLNYLDRGNVGNAKVLNEETGDDLLQQTHMTSTGYAITLSLFSVAYTLFELPSNWIIKRYVRPSIWLGLLLLCWGATTLGFAGVHSYAEVIVLRFLIGVFEAGFFPGIVYFTTFCGLQGFRWLFIIEGIITVLCALLLLFFLPDYPSRAKWLTQEEKRLCDWRLQQQGAGYTKAHATRKEIMETCFSPRMLLHYIIYVFNTIPLASFTFYTATIVTGLGYKSLEAQLLTIPPWVVGYLCALLYSFLADRFNARGYYICFGSILGGLGWLISGCLPAHSYTARYGCLVLASAGAFPCVAPLSAWITGNVPSVTTMAIATALNNSASGISQIIAQWIWKASEAERGYPTGNFTCAACSFVVAFLSIVLRIWYGRMNKAGVADASGKPKVWAY